MRDRWMLLLMALLAALTFPMEGQAGFKLRLEPASGGAITVGGTATFSVFLHEEAGTVLREEKLFSAGILLSYNSPLGIAQIVSTADVVENPLFDTDTLVKTNDTTLGFATLIGSKFEDPPISPDANNEVFLGTFTLTGLTGGSVTLKAEALIDSSNIYTLTAQGTILDGEISPGMAELTVEGGVSVVPLPASFILFSMGGAMAFGYAGWKSRRAAARTAPPKGVR